MGLGAESGWGLREGKDAHEWYNDYGSLIPSCLGMMLCMRNVYTQFA